MSIRQANFIYIEILFLSNLLLYNSFIQKSPDGALYGVLFLFSISFVIKKAFFHFLLSVFPAYF